MPDAGGTGPRNEIDIFTRRKTGVFGPETQPQAAGKYLVDRTSPTASLERLKAQVEVYRVDNIGR
jgi:hypothetical protein